MKFHPLVRYLPLIAIMLASCLRALGAAGTPVINSASDLGRPFYLAIPLPDGSYYAISDGHIDLLDPSGHILPTFKCAFMPGTVISCAARDKAGNVFLGGLLYIGTGMTTVVKLLPDGTRVQGFKSILVLNSMPSLAADQASFPGIAPDDLGGCYIGGPFDSINLAPADGLAHIDGNGNITLLNRLVPHQRSGSPIFLVRTSDALVVLESNSAYRILDTGAVVAFPSHALPWNAIKCATYDSAYGLALAGQTANGAYCYVYDDSGVLKSSFTQTAKFYQGPGPLAWDRAGRLLAGSATIIFPLGATRDTYGVKRLLATGAVDPDWSRTLTFDAGQGALVSLPDGRIAVSGAFSHVNGIAFSGYVLLSGDRFEGTRLANHSTRGSVGNGLPPLIAGFVIDGSTAVDVLIRVAGPSLQQFGVSRTPLQTQFSIYRVSQRVVDVLPGLASVTYGNPYAESDAIATATTAVGAFPLVTKGLDEAEMLISLSPGVYSFVIGCPAGQSGEVLGEVYFP